MPNYTLQTMCCALRGKRKNQNQLKKMSKGFINITTSGQGDIAYYLREKECIGYKHSKEGLTKEEILKSWETLAQNEKLGNKSLGIRGRHDAQVRKNYMLSMPNQISPQDCIHRVEKVISQTGIKNCTYTLVVHRGEKDGVKNQHIHLLVNERNLETMKKDREMIKRDWLEKTFRPTYQKEFAKEFEQGADLPSRDRIAVGLYESDKDYAREVIKELASVSQEASKSNDMGLLEALQSLAMMYEKDKEQERQEALAAQLQREREQELRQEQQRQQSRGNGFSMGSF